MGNEGKLSKASVGFESPAKGKDHCGQCIHFLGDAEQACKLVAGQIDAEDWCRMFQPSATSS
jgi:hypothetical protein